MTTEEAKQIALDIFSNKIFHSEMIPPHDIHMVKCVFMPLALMNKKQMQELATSNVKLFYEYYDKAGPRSINGYPTFMSMHMLCGANFDMVRDHLEKIKRAMTDIS